MLSATYLGHQGWTFATPNARIIVDPVLDASFGRGPRGANFPNHPPRRFALGELGPVDALVLSHEHEDHFHVPTLHLFDRAIPVYLSERSSIAARELLDAMGFGVTLLRAGASVTFRDLELRTFSPDHLNHPNLDEWDCLPFGVRELGRGGGFVTNIDVFFSDAMLRVVPDADNFYERYAVLFQASTLRRNTLALGAVDAERSTTITDPDDALAALRRGTPFEPIPGQTVELDGNAIAGVSAAPFVSSPPSSTWPAKPPWVELARADDYSPACGQPELAADAIAELEAGLDDFARYLYGTTVFKALYSIDASQLGKRRATFALMLRADACDSYLLYEYNPQACCFDAIDDDRDLTESYVAVLECWASDLVAVFRGDLEPRVLSLGRARMWHPVPSLFACHLFADALWPCFHPLRFPDRCLRRYLEIFASLADPAERIVPVPANHRVVDA